MCVSLMKLWQVFLWCHDSSVRWCHLSWTILSSENRTRSCSNKQEEEIIFKKLYNNKQAWSSCQPWLSRWGGGFLLRMPFYQEAPSAPWQRPRPLSPTTGRSTGSFIQSHPVQTRVSLIYWVLYLFILKGFTRSLPVRGLWVSEEEEAEPVQAACWTGHIMNYQNDFTDIGEQTYNNDTEGKRKESSVFIWEWIWKHYVRHWDYQCFLTDPFDSEWPIQSTKVQSDRTRWVLIDWLWISLITLCVLHCSDLNFEVCSLTTCHWNVQR